jgi:hypothetical protein
MRVIDKEKDSLGSIMLTSLSDEMNNFEVLDVPQKFILL